MRLRVDRERQVFSLDGGDVFGALAETPDGTALGIHDDEAVPLLAAQIFFVGFLHAAHTGDVAARVVVVGFESIPRDLAQVAKNVGAPHAASVGALQLDLVVDSGKGVAPLVDPPDHLERHAALEFAGKVVEPFVLFH